MFQFDSALIGVDLIVLPLLALWVIALYRTARRDNSPLSIGEPRMFYAVLAFVVALAVLLVVMAINGSAELMLIGGEISLLLEVGAGLYVLVQSFLLLLRPLVLARRSGHTL